jgi:cysteine desulfurase
MRRNSVGVRSATSKEVPKKGAIYLDAHASTPVSEGAVEAMLSFFTTHCSNPSAPGLGGRIVADAIAGARREVAALLSCDPDEVVFTSGATEALNMALSGFVRRRTDAKPHIVLSPVEHKAVIEPVKALARQGEAKCTFLSVDSEAKIDLGQFETLAKDGVDLLCLMKGNNEVGTIYDVEGAATIAQQYDVTVLSDLTQAIGWVQPEQPLFGAHMGAISAHKFHGPKGVGALAIRSGLRIEATCHGGAQERGLRPGTQNVPGIIGMGAAAAEIWRDRAISPATLKVAGLRDRLLALLDQKLPSRVMVNGAMDARLPNNLHISIRGVPNEILLARLYGRVCFSLGSACTASEDGPSHVLSAMALPRDRMESAVRFGLSRATTEKEVLDAAELIGAAALEILSQLGGSKTSLQVG